MTSDNQKLQEYSNQQRVQLDGQTDKIRTLENEIKFTGNGHAPVQKSTSQVTKPENGKYLCMKCNILLYSKVKMLIRQIVNHYRFGKIISILYPQLRQ